MSRPILRELQEADKDFIFSSWLQSYWDGCIKKLMVVRKDVYFRQQHKLIEKLLNQISVNIACLNDSPDIIIGWACFVPINPCRVHYVYVKNAFRKMGLTRMLLPPAIGQVTHLTQTAREILELRKIKNGTELPIFNPWFLMGVEDGTRNAG